MSIYEFQVQDNLNQSFDLKSNKGKVLLIVNTASNCGFTPQYDELEALYQKYKEEGLEILAFPCNQFGAQEPGSNEEIISFCKLNYGVTFPIMNKVEVNGTSESPLFTYLKKEAPGTLGLKKIKWNFTKFLMSRDGENIIRFAPTTKPSNMVKEIKEFLSKK